MYENGAQCNKTGADPIMYHTLRARERIGAALGVVMVAFTRVPLTMTCEHDGGGAISRFEVVLLVTACITFTAYVVVQNVRIGV